jgi:AcrR family transcriptional regulator
MKVGAKLKTSGSKPVREEGTCFQLLEAAGRVFADKGFDRATITEICE